MATNKAFPRPSRKADSKFFFQLNCLLAETIHSGLTIKALRILAGIKYLQRGTEEIWVGEVHAIYYEVTKDVSWSYETCRAMCNDLSKKGWLVKHKVGIHVGYTLTDQAVTLLAQLDNKGE